MKKHFRILPCVLALILMMTTTAVPMAAASSGDEPETLTIWGDGLEKELVLSRAVLEGLTSVIEQHHYSMANNFPTDKTEYASGIPLQYLLEQAGIKDEAQMLTFLASDGYRREFTVSELLSAPRYFYPETGEESPVPTMICLQSGTDGFDSLEPIDLRLIMGQRSPGEQTNPWFVKYLSEIEVSCEKPGKWSEVTFSRVAGPYGVRLTLSHTNFDAVKIYYTTDGSTPTVNSKMYNISASYYQPQLNEPLLIDKTTVVRAVAIGPGREDSAVSTITVSFDDEVFSDLAGFDWAKDAIEALTEMEIVDGVGNNRFDPSGSLNRGMFVTMLGRALNKETTSGPAATDGQFPDVDYGSWYGPHVSWAVALHIVTGYPDGTFKPGNTLSVQEMITMAVRAGGIDVPTSDAEPDAVIAGVDEWAMPYALAAETSDMLVRDILSKETPGGITVDGTRQATRAEAAVIVYALLQALE